MDIWRYSCNLYYISQRGRQWGPPARRRRHETSHPVQRGPSSRRDDGRRLAVRDDRRGDARQPGLLAADRGGVVHRRDRPSDRRTATARSATWGGRRSTACCGWPTTSRASTPSAAAPPTTSCSAPAATTTSPAAAGNDVIWGDQLIVGNGPHQIDTLIGGAGNDWIYPSHGKNTMRGGPGDDHIIAYYGHGTIDCGPDTTSRRFVPTASTPSTTASTSFTSVPTAHDPTATASNPANAPPVLGDASHPGSTGRVSGSRPHAPATG